MFCCFILAAQMTNAEGSRVTVSITEKLRIFIKCNR